jgi:hypothetical protein
MRAWRILILTMSLLLFPAGLIKAEAPPPPSRTLAELEGLFPSLSQLPPGMVLQEAGGRTAEEIVATFPDTQDALQAMSLQVSDWKYNTYRVYVAQPNAPLDTPARIEVSLHQFSSAGGAAYMLPYFANGRAVALGQHLQAPWLLGPCRMWVQGIGEGTLYMRVGDLLARITVVVPDGVTGYDIYIMTTSTMYKVADAILANANSARQELEQTCQ